MAAAIIWNYRTYFIERDFLLHDAVECDPSLESCFVEVCDAGDEECDDEWTYKKITESARNVPACSSYQGDCPPLSCEPNESECTETVCSVASLEEGERCTDETDIPEEPAEGDEEARSEEEV